MFFCRLSGQVTHMMHTKKSKLIKEANELLVRNQLAAATHIYEKICGIDANDAANWTTLGELYWRLNQRQAAANCYQKSVALEPDNSDSFFKLAVALHSLGRFAEALSNYKQSLKLNPGSAETYFYLGNLFKDQNLYDQAEDSYRKSLQLNPKQARAHCYFGNMLQRRCLIDEAIASYNRALKQDPGLSEAIWSKLRLLPIINESTEQLDKYRQHYAEGLQQLDEQLNLDTPAQVNAALWGILSSSGFLLQYQGRDDRELQQKFGNLVQRTMAAHFPQWSRPIAMHPLKPGERIRIGYASSYLYAHNGAIWLLGWLRQHDKSRFEVFCYHTGNIVDDKTKEFREYADHFYHLPNDLKRPCEQIVSDKLHILVYPELGMYAPTQLMAGLYLAPVQCTSWGHPVTSGFSTLDYWISSDLMEPENGQEHYSEKLIRLPNIAISYSRDQSDSINSKPVEKKRADFGLREDAVLYFCSQSLFKYLPENDHLLPTIAKKVPDAQFVFLEVLNKEVGEIFKKRIDLAFSEVGLNADDYCVILPRLIQEDYVIMNQLVDVFLDNPSWSGANTTLTAIDCNLPVVTLPTAFMRGRHSYAILKMMGITETIADSIDEYVKIAIRLGVDLNWRSEMRQKIKETKHKLYDDKTCVKGLEKFYEQAVKDKLR